MADISRSTSVALNEARNDGEILTVKPLASLSNTVVYDRWAPTYDSLAQNPGGTTIQTIDDNELTSLLPKFLDRVIQSHALSSESQYGPQQCRQPIKVVDFGCGTGRNTFKLQRMLAQGDTVVGLDASSGMLDIARQRYATMAAETKDGELGSAGLEWHVYDPLETAVHGDGSDGHDGHAKTLPSPPPSSVSSQAVISTCVMQHLPLSAFFATVESMVTSSGHILITDSHPDLAMKTQIEYKDPETGERAWGTSYVHPVAETLEYARSRGWELVDEPKEVNGEANMVGALKGDWSGVRAWYAIMLKRVGKKSTLTGNSANVTNRTEENREVWDGWLAQDNGPGEAKLTWGTYKPKAWTERDIDVNIECCGVCGTDLATLSGAAGPIERPCCIGHEIVGRVVKAGQEVERDIKVGDRVGIGAQVDSCRKSDCPQCATGQENYCQRGFVLTYNDQYSDGSTAQGGFSRFIRAPFNFAVKIPEVLPSTAAAPLLCAGVTVYSPLKRLGVGPGKRIGVVGVGGLGHLGIIFAKALGCKAVTAISRTIAKKDDALRLGATAYIARDEQKSWVEEHEQSLDLILCTTSSAEVPLDGLLRTLRVGGNFVQVGEPESPLPQVNLETLMRRAISFTGTCIGSPAEIEEMLCLAAEKGLRPWTEERPMDDCNQVIADLAKGKARYRFVLVNSEQQASVVRAVP